MILKVFYIIVFVFRKIIFELHKAPTLIKLFADIGITNSSSSFGCLRSSFILQKSIYFYPSKLKKYSNIDSHNDVGDIQHPSPTSVTNINVITNIDVIANVDVIIIYEAWIKVYTLRKSMPKIVFEVIGDYSFESALYRLYSHR